MTCCNQSKTEEIKLTVQSLYPWLTGEDIELAYNRAVADYIGYLYPSANGRPTPETLSYDFFCVQWLQDRMLDIVSRAGGSNVSAYKENGIDIKYGASYIDPNLVMRLGLPKAGVPR